MFIHLDQIVFSYPQQRDYNIIEINELTLEAGKKYFIHGPSGSGKSTFLNLLSGMVSPSSGEITVLTERLDKLSARQRDRFRAQNIGYIYQQFNLIPYLDALENIKLASYFDKSKAHRNVEHTSMKLLTKLNISPVDWTKPVQQLSVGQQQRVGIARAMINQPKLIIADEPTSSLDQNAIDNFMNLLIELCDKNKTTLVFVSHDKTLATFFDFSLELADFNKVN